MDGWMDGWIGILLGGVSWSIYYILRMADVEMDHGRDDLGYKTGDTNSSPAE